MSKIIFDRYEYRVHKDIPSFCYTIKFDNTIIVEEALNNKGTSIRDSFSIICSNLVYKYDIDINNLIYIEKYDNKYFKVAFTITNSPLEDYKSFIDKEVKNFMTKPIRTEISENDYYLLGKDVLHYNCLNDEVANI